MTARDDATDTDAAHAASAAELASRAGELARLEALAEAWAPDQQALWSAMKTGIEALHAQALRRLVRTVRDDPAARPALHRAVADPLLYHVLRFHGLVKEPLAERVQRALDAVRPALAEHGGDVELVAVLPPDRVQVRLVGACQSCPSSGETLSEGVEKSIRTLCPEIVHVERVSRGAVSTEQPLRFVSPFARADDAGWTDLCALQALPDGAAASHTLDGRALLLYRQGEAVSCMDDACAHMGLPLHPGRLDGERLQCPHHGFVYRLDTGECLSAPQVQLTMHAVRVVGDRVAVRLQD